MLATASSWGKKRKDKLLLLLFSERSLPVSARILFILRNPHAIRYFQLQLPLLLI
jgi:hypothetical protein